MIRNIDINNEGCGNLDGLKACLDYPTCGYDNSDTLLIAGWILPSDPLNNNIQVIVKVEENNEQHEFNTIRVNRPDVLKAHLSKIQLPESASQVGFSVRIPLQSNAKASIIIVRDGQEIPWYNVNITVNNSLTEYIKKLNQPNENSTDVIDAEEIISTTKIYYSHLFQQSPPSVIHKQLNKLRQAVHNDEFIVALYNSEYGKVKCNKSTFKFNICSSKSLNDHNFLFCRDDSDNEFIVHQHVTSIDGVYYPHKGIYYTFCHGSENRLSTILKFLLKNNTYFKDKHFRNKAFLIGHGRPYHFMYDGMLGFEIIYEHVKEIDNQTKFYTLENNAFINAPKIFNSNQTAEFITNKTLTQLEIEATLFIKIGALFGNGAKDPVIMNRINNLDKKVLSYISNIHTDKENSTNELKKHFPIIWLGVTGQKRAWLEQVEGYSNIINKLYETFPGMAVVFDGWTSSLVTLQRDKVETANDRSIIDDIKNRIAPDIRTVDLVGATIDRKIHIGSVVDCAIVNYSTGSMNISRICGRPCITHMNNSFSPARNQHIHQNAHHIPDEYVTDVMDNDSRIDATSYHIDWENIYSAMTLHLGKNNLIQKRW
ncbi:hypothetical protein RNI28_004995 [Escherichia coli]|nr:hypothetical protein [Escherichia coli]